MKRPSLSHFVFVIAVLSIWNGVVDGQDVELVGKHICTDAGNGQMRFLINIVEKNGNSLATVRAVNASGGEINTCIMTRSGSTSTVESVVTLATNTESNTCAMRVSIVNGVTYYTWHFRGVVISRGFVINATCSKNDISPGSVTTLAKFNITRMSVNARNPASVTGPNSFANGSDLILTAVIYPDGLNSSAVLKNAKGFSLRNCYSGTDAAVLENRELMIDSDGCPVSGSTYAPSGPPQKRPGSGLSPLIVDASFIRSTKLGNESMVFITCNVLVCNMESQCDNVCNASRNNVPITSSVFTTETLNTNFVVQDVPVTTFIASLDGLATPLESIDLSSNTAIRLVGTFAPNGVGQTNNVFRSAKGFYLHSCRYSENSNFRASTDFVNSNGCFVPGTKLSAESEFQLTSSENNQYTITSGLINLQSDTTYLRLWIQCRVGACKVDGHNRCNKMRCGATNDDPTNAQDNLGVVVQLSLSILNSTNQESLTIQVGDGTGIIDGGEKSVLVNTPVPFGASVIPNSQSGSGVFDGAKGAYLRNCYASEFENPTDEQKISIVDDKGCRIEGPYAPSQECVLDTTFPGVPPFDISCGTITPPNTGTLYHVCSVGKCDTANNMVCKNRCAAGALGPDSNASDSPATFSASTKVRARDDRRTAVRANQVVAAVIGITVVVPIAVLCVVALITYCIVNSQRPK